jgi:alpha-L-rhamnosidase
MASWIFLAALTSLPGGTTGAGAPPAAERPGAHEAAAAAPRPGGALAPARLQCESRIDPLGIDVRQPRLSWVLVATEEARRGLSQTAFQVLVASDPGKLGSGQGDLWDSGKVTSDQNAQVAYAGKPLGSGQDCWWKLRVWDPANQASPWSQPARWSMGLLATNDWSAQWIGIKAGTDSKLPPATYWRREIDTGRKIARAWLYASALGDYVLRLNGQRVGEDYFNPGWTDFRKRVYYHTYEVTPLLRSGRNCLAAVLSTGWYAGYIWAGPFNYGTTPKLLVQLNVEYEDGTRQVFGTGADWKTACGPLLEADLQQGETYDARREFPDWDRVGFQDQGWRHPELVLGATPVQVERDNQSARLCAAPHPPVRRQREIRPRSLSCPRPGVYVFDLGESIAGWARLRAQGPAGTRVALRFSGRLNPDGTLYTDYLREARVKDTYILKGSAQAEAWEPLFTYHGFQYVEVAGYPGAPTLEDITGIACHSDLARTGSFACSDPRVNQLYKNSVDSMIANLVDLPTGCSDRAERLGSMGVGQRVYSWCYSFDMNAFLTKWMTDIVDAQSLGASGSYLQVSPIWGDIESPGWSDDGVCVPYGLYRFYGNTNLIAEQYPSLKTYLGHLERSLTNYLRNGAVFHCQGEKFIGYGDWLAIVEDRERHADVLNTLWNGWSVSNLAEMAASIGQREDARHYERLLDNMKKAFDRAYLAADGKIIHDTQGEYALGLYFGFIPEQKIARAVAHLVEDILRKSHTQTRENPLKKTRVIPPGHLTTGFHSSRALLPVLSRHGRNAVAYQLLLEDTYPSWLYPVAQGATSAWERWDSWMPEAGFQDSRMNSFGMPHLMASIVEWLMAYAGGLQSDGVGFKRIAVKPYPGPGLGWAEATYQSIHGKIAVKWTRLSDGALTLRVAIPPNTQATIGVPKDGRTAVAVAEGGVSIWAKQTFRGQAAGIASASEDATHVNFQVASGQYEFRAVPEGDK